MLRHPRRTCRRCAYQRDQARNWHASPDACHNSTTRSESVDAIAIAGSVLECRSSSFEAAEAALLAPLRDPPLPGGGNVVHTSRMAVDTFQVMLKPCHHCLRCFLQHFRKASGTIKGSCRSRHANEVVAGVCQSACCVRAGAEAGRFTLAFSLCLYDLLLDD